MMKNDPANLLQFMNSLLTVMGQTPFFSLLLFFICFPAKGSCRQLPDASSPSFNASVFIAENIKAGKKPNRLIKEKSPYLLKHAFTPIDWYPWGDEAMQKAGRENRPIMLSIGYSACHWCNVMGEETFTNDKVAAILNRMFVSIKVDREVRPDLDAFYLEVSLILTGRGGWPMTIFLTPDLKPFYAGTYYPAEPKYGKQGFADLLMQIGAEWQNNPASLEKKGAEVLARLKSGKKSKQPDTPTEISRSQLAVEQFKAKYDDISGGFGRGSKFPRSFAYDFLLRQLVRTDDIELAEMISFSLQNIAKGALRDQLGGGFHRYTIDPLWRIPHFEKMLYDQALLATTFTEAFQQQNIDLYKSTALETLEFMLSDMRNSEGGFYAALDADSNVNQNSQQKSEGAYYLWAADEIKELLSPEEYNLFTFCYGVKAKGNARYDPLGEFAGKNILFLENSSLQAAEKFDMDESAVNAHLASARQKLLAARKKRPPPYIDDKIITGWNGLAISALSLAGMVFNQPEMIKTATATADFIYRNLYLIDQNDLLRYYRKGSSKAPAQLDDYAFLIQGLLDLFEATQDIRWLQWAKQLMAKQIELFGDKSGNGFFDTRQDRFLPIRLKNDYEGALPGGNSVSALNLTRLGQFYNDSDMIDLAELTVSAFAAKLNAQPAAMPYMLIAEDAIIHKPMQIVIAGDKDAPETAKMLHEIYSHLIPARTIILLKPENRKVLAEKNDFLKFITKIGEKATAYVCVDYTCRLPTNDILILRRQLLSSEE